MLTCGDVGDHRSVDPPAEVAAAHGRLARQRQGEYEIGKRSFGMGTLVGVYFHMLLSAICGIAIVYFAHQLNIGFVLSALRWVSFSGSSIIS